VLSFPANVRIYAATHPVDGRKGIDGLSAAVRSAMGHDPLCGDIFLFLSRRRDRARILYFSHNGYWLITRRLEMGRFHFPWDHTPEGMSRLIDNAQLLLLLEGIDLRGAHHRPRWAPPATSR
jgi:transposase